MPSTRRKLTYPVRCCRRIGKNRLLAVLKMAGLSDAKKTALLYEIFEDKADAHRVCSFRSTAGEHISMDYIDLNHRDRLLLAIMEDPNIVLNKESLEILADYIIEHNPYRHYFGDLDAGYSRGRDLSKERQTYVPIILESYPKIISRKEISRDFLWEHGHIRFILGTVNKDVRRREVQARKDKGTSWARIGPEPEPYLGRWIPREIKLLLTLCSNTNLTPLDCEKIYYLIESPSLRKEVMDRDGIFVDEYIKIAISLYEKAP